VASQVSQAQIEKFQRDGFVVIEGFFSAEELETWRRVTDEAVRARLERRGGLTNQNSDEFYKNVFTQCLRLADDNEEVKRLVTDERLGEVAAQLVGVNGVRIWHDQALIKQPYGNQTAWHRDTPYWAVHSRKTVNMWFALDDATLENGCLWYLPGTHLLGDYRLVKIGSNMRDLFTAYPEWLSIAAVPAPCPAGSAVIHNGMTAHAAGANMTPRPRRAMTSVYFPDGERYNGQPDTLPEVYYKTLEVGKPLNDDRYVPLVWRRKTQASVSAV
jgi:ectoine hydroxylase-related dioxygenase (phytanoyl-CoA dioxygenase family)